MAKRMKDYQIFKCPFCSCEYFDDTARKGKTVGSPGIKCPNCKEVAFRKDVYEPALLDENRHFDIRFSELYSNIRTVIICLYAVFLFFILVTKDFTLAMSFIVAAAVIFGLYLIIRVVHKKNYLESPEFEVEINRSMARLSDVNYAIRVIKNQGIDETSVYYFQLHQNGNGES